MQKNMPHICGTCSIYAAYMHHIFRQIQHIFPHILPPKLLEAKYAEKYADLAKYAVHMWHIFPHISIICKFE